MFKKTLITFAICSTVWMTAGIAQSQPTLGATAATSTNAQGAKMAAGFAGFAGSTENAQSMVNGLRTGTSITLGPSETGPNSTAPSANLSPATGTMGYGNVRTAISLAQASLAKQGVTNPTPSQLSAALGGILGERAQGLGWGQIAKGMGVKLGSVVSASRTNKSTQSGLAKMDKTDNASNGLAKGKSSGSTGNAGGNSGGNGGKGGGGGGGNGGGNGGGKG